VRGGCHGLKLSVLLCSRLRRIETSCRVPRARLLEHLLPKGAGALAYLTGTAGSSSGELSVTAAEAEAVGSEKAGAWMAKIRRDPKARTHLFQALRDISVAEGMGDAVPQARRPAAPFSMGFSLHASADLWALAVEKFDADVFGALQASLAIAQSTRSCPRCCAVIERISGCNHMICSMCATAFCWVSSDCRLQGVRSSAVALFYAGSASCVWILLKPRVLVYSIHCYGLAV